MGIISRGYLKNFICRYDREVGVPYYSVSDFKGLHEEIGTIVNSNKQKIHYYFYYFDNYKEDKIVLFCPGLSAGHCCYMMEIASLAKKGYKVLTYDHQGCGESEGKNMYSLNQPTRDVNTILDELKIDKPIVLVGHSLGGYTSLNLINMRKDINKAVIISGFLKMKLEISGFVKSKFIIKGIMKYERKVQPELYKLDNVEYLKETKDQLLFIHSEDDTMVPYETSMKLVEGINNPNIRTCLLTNRKHNPNYSDSAIEYMNEVFGNFYQLIKDKKIKTDEDKIEYFKPVILEKLVEQDEKVIAMICDFIG